MALLPEIAQAIYVSHDRLKQALSDDNCQSDFVRWMAM